MSLLITVIAFLAFFVKALSGFGPAMVFIGLTTLLLPAHAVVVCSSLLDFIAGMLLLRVDWQSGKLKFWLPLAVAIMAGTVVGGLFLDDVPAETLRIGLAWFVLILGFWFLSGLSSRPGSSPRVDVLPGAASALDIFISFVSGVLGGLTGISGPILIWYLARKFNKRAFRQALVLIFVGAAFSRSATYFAIGLVDIQVWLAFVSAVPGLVLGLYLGNRLHFSVSESLFHRSIGVLLILAGLAQSLGD